MKVNNKKEFAASSPRDASIADRLSDRLATLLSDQISSGTLCPGDRLPTEQQLALRHGVSRTVVREAVHQLESRRLVRARQGAGVFVSPPMLNSPLEFDPHVLESVQSPRWPPSAPPGHKSPPCAGP
jgi:GntR family transcriptional repressor for pyruvate dehydrogenase complex